MQSSPADTCWKQAYDSLDDNLRVILNRVKTGRRNVLEAAIQTAEQKREICMLKQWKFKLPGGDVIIIRDVVEKIAKWIKLFASVGDVAVNFSPETAALPWAAVRFVLQVAISDNQVQGEVVADLEVVSRLIARYGEFERVHLKRQQPTQKHLQEGLTRLYAKILEFLATTVKYFDQNTFSRGVKNALRAPDRSQMDSITHNEAELLKMADLSDTERLNYLQESMTRLVDQASRVEKTLDEEKHLELLRWLSLSPYTRHLEAISEMRMPGSAGWLLGHTDYRSWRNSSSSSILLLHGIPGSGKSNVASAVVDSFLTDNASNPLAAPLAYFFCSDDQFEIHRSQPAEVLRSIVRQLTIAGKGKPLVRDIILSEFDRKLAQSKIDGMDMPKLSQKECVDLILEVTNSDPITIVIDALDTITEQDRPALIRSLMDIVRRSANIAKVFLTSRNDSQVFSLVRGDHMGPAQQANSPVTLSIEVHQDNSRQDIRAYVAQKLTQVAEDKRLLAGKPSSNLVDLLTEKLVAGAGEMFQWVNIQVEYLCRFSQEEDIMLALDNMELGCLEDAYTLVLDRLLSIGTASREIAVRAFSWLLHVQEALHPNDFIAAVFDERTTDVFDLEKSKVALLTICSNLISLDLKCCTFRFSHQSVRDFLQKQDVFSATESQRIITEACLRVCMQGPRCDTGPSFGKFDGYYQYAALYWAWHSRQSNGSQYQEDMASQVIAFVYDEPGDVSLAFLSWLEHIESLSETLVDHHSMKTISEAMPNEQCSALFVASAFGLDYLLTDDAIGPESPAWDQKNKQGHTCLYLACAQGNLSTAKMLLDRGSNPNIRCGRFGTALQASSFKGHDRVAELLLQYGALTYEPGLFSNALEACYRGQQESTALVLLQHESTIRNVDEFDSAMTGAAQAGLLAVIGWLRKSPLCVLHQGEHVDKVKTKTTKAIQGGQHGVLSSFLKGKKSYENQLPDGPIALAVLHGHENVVDLLTDMALDIESECELGSPLRCAALTGRESITRKLLRLNADVNRCGRHGTALQAASMRGHVRIVKLLIQSGAKVNHVDKVYGTALQAAAFHGHRNVVEGLLDAGAMVHLGAYQNSREPVSCKDAFHDAAEGGHYDIVALLLDRGYRPQVPFRRPQGSIIGPPTSYNSLLQDYGAGYTLIIAHALWIFSDDMAARTPSREPREVARGSLADAQIDKMLRRTPLEELETVLGLGLVEAAAFGNTHIAGVILETHGVVSGDDLRDAFRSACDWGRAETARRLLSAAADGRGLLVKDLLAEGLNISAARGHKALLEMFVDARRVSGEGVSVFSRPRIFASEIGQRVGLIDEYGDIGQGLSVAALYGQESLIPILLSAGARVNDIVSEPVVHNRYCLGDEGDLLGRYPRHRSMTNRARLRREDSKRDSTRQGVDRRLSAAKGRSNSHMARYNALQAALAGIQRMNEQRDHYSYRREVRESLPGRERIVKILLDQGADPNGWGGCQERPIIVAARSCSERVVNWLILAGADVNVTDGGTSALLEAAGREQAAASVFRCLLHAGASLESEVYASTAIAEKFLWFFKGNAGFRHPQTLDDVFSQGLGLVAQIVLTVIPSMEAKLEGFPGVLQGAAAIGDRACVDLLLSRGVEVNFESLNYGTGLQAAARFGRTDVVQSLLEAGADPSILGGYHKTALRAAVIGGHGESVRLLLHYGADVHQTTNDEHGDDWLLSLAVIAKDPATVATLLSAGLDAAAGPPGHTPSVLLACRKGNLETVRVLLRHGASVETHHIRRPDSERWYYANDWYESPLHVACTKGYEEMARLLIDHGVDIELEFEQSGTPLQAAAGSGHTGIVCMLMQAGALPDHISRRGHTALSLAAAAGHLAIVQELLAAGALVYNPETGTNAIKSACRSRNVAVTELLIQSILDDRKRTEAILEAFEEATSGGENHEQVTLLSENMHMSLNILHKACITGTLSVVRTALDDGIPVDGESGEEGDRAIHIAARNLRAEVLHLLVQRGAAMNHAHSGFGTALSAAIYSCVERMLPGQTLQSSSCSEVEGDWDSYSVVPMAEQVYRCRNIVRILLEHGARVDSEPRALGHALHLACFLGDVEIIEALLEAGSDIHVDSGYFGFPLFAAVHAGHLQAVKLLLVASGQMDYEHPQLGTPLFLACKNHHVWVARYILDSGADANILGPDGTSPLSRLLVDPKPPSHFAIGGGSDLSQRRPEVGGLVEAFLKNPRGLKIHGCDIVEAIRSSGHRRPSSVVWDLLDHDKDTIVPEEAILLYLTMFSDRYEVKENLQRLVERLGQGGVTEAMMVKAQTLNAVSILLKHRPRCPITRDIINAKRDAYDKWKIKRLLIKARLSSSVYPRSKIWRSLGKDLPFRNMR